jgi:hypothetical protein
MKKLAPMVPVFVAAVAGPVAHAQSPVTEYFFTGSNLGNVTGIALTPQGWTCPAPVNGVSQPCLAPVNVIDDFPISLPAGYTMGLTNIAVAGENDSVCSGRGCIPSRRDTQIPNAPVLMQAQYVIVLTITYDALGNPVYLDGAPVQYDATGKPLAEDGSSIGSCNQIANADGTLSYVGCETGYTSTGQPIQTDATQDIGPATDVNGNALVFVDTKTSAGAFGTIDDWNLNTQNPGGTLTSGAVLAPGLYNIEYSALSCTGRNCGTPGGSYLFVRTSIHETPPPPPPCGDECGAD